MRFGAWGRGQGSRRVEDVSVESSHHLALVRVRVRGFRVRVRVRVRVSVRVRASLPGPTVRVRARARARVSLPGPKVPSEPAGVSARLEHSENSRAAASKVVSPASILALMAFSAPRVSATVPSVA